MSSVFIRKRYQACMKLESPDCTRENEKNKEVEKAGKNTLDGTGKLQKVISFRSWWCVLQKLFSFTSLALVNLR